MCATTTRDDVECGMYVRYWYGWNVRRAHGDVKRAMYGRCWYNRNVRNGMFWHVVVVWNVMTSWTGVVGM